MFQVCFCRYDLYCGELVAAGLQCQVQYRLQWYSGTVVQWYSTGYSPRLQSVVNIYLQLSLYPPDSDTRAGHSTPHQPWPHPGPGSGPGPGSSHKQIWRHAANCYGSSEPWQESGSGPSDAESWQEPSQSHSWHAAGPAISRPDWPESGQGGSDGGDQQAQRINGSKQVQ